MTSEIKKEIKKNSSKSLNKQVQTKDSEMIKQKNVKNPEKDIILKINDVSKWFMTANGNKTVLENFSMNIEKGKMYGVTGPSGSGKSTVLQIAGLLNPPSSGEVLISQKIYNEHIATVSADELSLQYVNIDQLCDDEQSKIRNKIFGFVYQFHYLMSDFSVIENIMMPSSINLLSNLKKEALDILKKLGIYEKADSMPFMLSGGERQRVAIARAVINKPAVLFADEPTGNLDEANENLVYSFLHDLVKSTGMSCVIATHSKNLIKKMDSIIEM